MSYDATIEQRLAAVEAAVAELKQRMTVTPPAANWLHQVSGSFKDELAFEEVLAYGRALRVADRPPEDAPP